MRRFAVVMSITGAMLVLSNFAFIPAQAGGGCEPSSKRATSARAGRSVTVAIQGCEFVPTVIHVPEHATVTWVNRDDVPHTVTGDHLRWGGIRELSHGKSVQFRFAASGTYPYYCMLHPGMAAAVVVGNGVSDETDVNPVAVVSSSGTKGPSSGSAQTTGSSGGLSTPSAIGIVVLALVAGVGVGIAIRSRGETISKQLSRT